MKKKLIVFFLILLFFISHFLNLNFLNINLLTRVHAQSPVPSPVQEVEINLSDYLVLRDGQRVSEVFQKPSDMVNLLVRVVFVGVGLFLFVLVVISGLSMISAGTSDSKDKAKTTMTSALIGFLVIFGAYWVMQIIQILTGINVGF